MTLKSTNIDLDDKYNNLNQVINYVFLIIELILLFWIDESCFLGF